MDEDILDTDFQNKEDDSDDLDEDALLELEGDEEEEEEEDLIPPTTAGPEVRLELATGPSQVEQSPSSAEEGPASPEPEEPPVYNNDASYNHEAAMAEAPEEMDSSVGTTGEEEQSVASSSEKPSQGSLQEPDSTVDPTGDSEDEDTPREKFVSERSNIIKLVPTMARTDIPDNLDLYITPEDAARVDAFLTKDKERKSRIQNAKRGGRYQRGNLTSPHKQKFQQQQQQHRPGSSLQVRVLGPAPSRKILINPHFRGALRPPTSSVLPRAALPLPPSGLRPPLLPHPVIPTPQGGGLFSRPPPPLPPPRLPPDFSRPPPPFLMVKHALMGAGNFTRPPPPLHSFQTPPPGIVSLWKQGPPPPLPPHLRLPPPPAAVSIPVVPAVIQPAAAYLAAPQTSTTRTYSRPSSPRQHSKKTSPREYRSKQPSSSSSRNSRPSSSHHFSKSSRPKASRSSLGSTVKEVPIQETEDEETRKLRKQIEQQKKMREEILRRKEERRRLRIQQGPNNASESPSENQGSKRPKPPEDEAPQPKKKVVQLKKKEEGGMLHPLRVVVNRGGSGAKATTPAGIQKHWTKVLVENLAASTGRSQLLQLAKAIGPVENIQLLTKEKKAVIKFKEAKNAALFQKKYQRHMLDLSMIQVSFHT